MADLTQTSPTPANADVEIEGTRACVEDIPAGAPLAVNSSGAYLMWKNGDAGRPRAVAPRAEYAGRNLTGHRAGVYGGYTGLTPGADVWTSPNDGHVAAGTATGAFVIGYAKTSSSIYFDFSVAAVAVAAS